MKHLPPIDALNSYRASSPSWVVEQAEEFKLLPIEQQSELIFYMLIHLTNAVTHIGDQVDIEIVELDGEKATN